MSIEFPWSETSINNQFDKLQADRLRSLPEDDQEIIATFIDSVEAAIAQKSLPEEARTLEALWEDYVNSFEEGSPKQARMKELTNIVLLQDIIITVFFQGVARWRQDNSNAAINKSIIEALWDQYCNNLSAKLKVRAESLRPIVNTMMDALIKDENFLSACKNIINKDEKAEFSTEERQFANAVNAVAILWANPEILDNIAIAADEKEKFQNLSAENETSRLRIAVEWIERNFEVVEKITQYSAVNAQMLSQGTDVNNRKKVLQIFTPIFLRELDRFQSISRMFNRGLINLDQVVVSKSMRQFFNSISEKIKNCSSENPNSLETELLACVKEMLLHTINDFRDIFPDLQIFDQFLDQFSIEFLATDNTITKRNKLIGNLMAAQLAVLASQFSAEKSELNQKFLGSIFEMANRFLVANIPDAIISQDDFCKAMIEDVTKAFENNNDRYKYNRCGVGSIDDTSTTCLSRAFNGLISQEITSPEQVIEDLLALQGKISEELLISTLSGVWIMSAFSDKDGNHKFTQDCVRKIVDKDRNLFIKVLESAIENAKYNSKSPEIQTILSVAAACYYANADIANLVMQLVVNYAQSFQLPGKIVQGVNVALQTSLTARDAFAKVLQETARDDNNEGLLKLVEMLEPITNPQEYSSAAIDKDYMMRHYLITQIAGLGKFGAQEAIKAILEKNIPLRYTLQFIGAIAQGKSERKNIILPSSGRRFYESIKGFSNIHNNNDIAPIFAEFVKERGLIPDDVHDVTAYIKKYITILEALQTVPVEAALGRRAQEFLNTIDGSLGIIKDSNDLEKILKEIQRVQVSLNRHGNTLHNIVAKIEKNTGEFFIQLEKWLEVSQSTESIDLSWITVLPVESIPDSEQGIIQYFSDIFFDDAIYDKFNNLNDDSKKAFAIALGKVLTSYDKNGYAKQQIIEKHVDIIVGLRPLVTQASLIAQVHADTDALNAMAATKVGGVTDFLQKYCLAAYGKNIAQSVSKDIQKITRGDGTFGNVMEKMHTLLNTKQYENAEKRIQALAKKDSVASGWIFGVQFAFLLRDAQQVMQWITHPFLSEPERHELISCYCLVHPEIDELVSLYEALNQADMSWPIGVPDDNTTVQVFSEVLRRAVLSKDDKEIVEITKKFPRVNVTETVNNIDYEKKLLQALQQRDTELPCFFDDQKIRRYLFAQLKKYEKSIKNNDIESMHAILHCGLPLHAQLKLLALIVKEQLNMKLRPEVKAFYEGLQQFDDINAQNATRVFTLFLRTQGEISEDVENIENDIQRYVLIREGLKTLPETTFDNLVVKAQWNDYCQSSFNDPLTVCTKINNDQQFLERNKKVLHDATASLVPSAALGVSSGFAPQFDRWIQWSVVVEKEVEVDDLAFIGALPTVAEVEQCQTEIANIQQRKYPNGFPSQEILQEARVQGPKLQQRLQEVLAQAWNPVYVEIQSEARKKAETLEKYQLLSHRLQQANNGEYSPNISEQHFLSPSSGLEKNLAIILDSKTLLEKREFQSIMGDLLFLSNDNLSLACVTNILAKGGFYFLQDIVAYLTNQYGSEVNLAKLKKNILPVILQAVVNTPEYFAQIVQKIPKSFSINTDRASYLSSGRRDKIITSSADNLNVSKDNSFLQKFQQWINTAINDLSFVVPEINEAITENDIIACYQAIHKKVFVIDKNVSGSIKTEREEYLLAEDLRNKFMASLQKAYMIDKDSDTGRSWQALLSKAQKALERNTNLAKLISSYAENKNSPQLIDNIKMICQETDGGKLEDLKNALEQCKVSVYSPRSMFSAHSQVPHGMREVINMIGSKSKPADILLKLRENAASRTNETRVRGEATAKVYEAIHNFFTDPGASGSELDSLSQNNVRSDHTQKTMKHLINHIQNALPSAPAVKTQKML